MPHFMHDPEFWVLVAAIIFVAVVWRPAKKGIVTTLDERSARIRAELDEAEKLRREAERLLAEYQQKQRAALDEAQAIAAHAREEAERVAAQGARDLETALERRKRLAEERIAQAEAKAVAEIRAAAVDAAITAARNVITSSLDDRTRAGLIDAAIQALPQGLN
ncbi:MAG TPA: F0F1 ATP synthase subunit B [Stellaceae bacterium]|jgi:F-type H+-transporting ATPase subunit b